jgi:hypothetical protein
MRPVVRQCFVDAIFRLGIGHGHRGCCNPPSGSEVACGRV